MLRPKKGFENTTVSFRMGSNTFTIKTDDITPELIERVKNYTDLSYFVEEYKPEPIKYDPQKHDVETVIQRIINEEPKKKTNKKKKP